MLTKALVTLALLLAGCSTPTLPTIAVDTTSPTETAAFTYPTVPNPTLTPGAVVPGCTPSTVADRAVTLAEKRDLNVAYGLPREPTDAERFDHRVPHALCGADGPLNLWPEAKEASKVKDRYEVAWINLVKLDPSLLGQAQACFEADWTHCGGTR